MAREITVVVGRFDAALGRSPEHVLRKDRRLCLLATGLDDLALEHVVASQAPRAVLVAETVEYALLVRLRARVMAPGLVVLARREPARLYRMSLRASVGAICLTYDASAADLLAGVQSAAGPTSALTRREAEVFDQLRKRRTDAEIAWRLKINVATVRTHTRAIFRKLGVNSRRELAENAGSGEGVDALM